MMTMVILRRRWMMVDDDSNLASMVEKKYKVAGLVPPLQQ